MNDKSGDVQSAESGGFRLSDTVAKTSWRRLARWTRHLVSIAIVLALAMAVYRERNTLLPAIFETEPWIFAIVAVATLVSWSVNSYSQGIILRALGKTLPFSMLFTLHAAGGLINHLPVRLGMVYRAHYLKQRAGLRYTRFGSFLFTSTVLYFCVTAVLGTLTIVVAYGIRESQAAFLASLLACFALATLALLVSPLPSGRFNWQPMQMLEDLARGRNLVIQNRRVLVVLVLAHTILVLMAALRLTGGFLALGMDVPFAASLALGAVSILSLAVSITPGGIGVQEFVVAATSTLIGIPFATGLAAAAVVRAVVLVLYLLVGLPSLAWLMRSA